MSVSTKKRGLDRAAELLEEHGLRRDLASNRGIMVGTAICQGLSEVGAHASDDLCRQLMTEVAGTLDCTTLHEAVGRFGDMTAEHWAIRLRAVGDGRLS